MSNQNKVYELPASEFRVVAPLFKDVWIDRALIDSIIEGTHLARVFVDDPQQPATVLMCSVRGDYIIMGNEGPGPVRQFIKDMPSEAGLFNRDNFAFFMPQIAWRDVLHEDFEGAITIFPTRSFRYSKLTIAPVEQWQQEGTGSDVRVQRIDDDMLDQIYRGNLKTGKQFGNEWQDDAEISRQELEDIARDYFGACAIVGNEIASVASAFGLSSKYASLSIDTAKPFRRRGLAILACVVLIEDCLERGLTPLWNCVTVNEASARTALKLGMEEGPSQRESQWRFAWKHIKPSKGLWSEERLGSDLQSGAIWRRA